MYKLLIHAITTYIPHKNGKSEYSRDGRYKKMNDQVMTVGSGKPMHRINEAKHMWEPSFFVDCHLLANDMPSRLSKVVMHKDCSHHNTKNVQGTLM